MKSIQFSESYKPFLNGPVQVIALMKEYASKHHDFNIFSSGKPIDEKKVFWCPKINVTQGYGLTFPKFNAKKTLKEAGIYHTHQPFTLGLYALYKSKKYKVPLIFTNHCQYQEYAKHYLPGFGKIIKPIIEKYVGWFINKCDYVILPSKTFYNTLVERFEAHPRKIVIIPNPIRNLPKINKREVEKLRNKYNLKNKKVLIYVGRLAKEKNVSFILRAYANLIKKYPDVFLIIVGGGPELDYLKKLALKLNIYKSIIFTGYQSNSVVFTYLSLADIFVSASLTEIHPITLLEAMSVGVAPVAVKAVGFSDTIENGFNGKLVEVLDEKIFSDSVLDLLKNEKKLADFKKKAKQSIKKYNPYDYMKRVESLYKKAIKEKRLG